MQCELAQLRCDAVIPFISARRSSIAVTSLRRYRSLVFFGCHHFHPGEDFIRRQYPIHRDGVTPLGRTTEPQWPVAARSDRYLDLPANDNLAANLTVTILD